MFLSPTQYTFKYILVGDSCVGKSCLLLQFTNHRFEHMHDMTIGIEFGTYLHTLDDGNIIKLQIWDTAGQESFKSITRSYYRNSVCALVVFDVTDETSYKNVIGWISDVKAYNFSPVTIVLIGNKCDLEDKRKIKRSDAERFAKENGVDYIETSARTSMNVNNAFLNSVPQIYKSIKEGKLDISHIGSNRSSVLTLREEKKEDDDSYNHNYCSAC